MSLFPKKVEFPFKLYCNRLCFTLLNVSSAPALKLFFCTYLNQASLMFKFLEQVALIFFFPFVMSI